MLRYAIVALLIIGGLIVGIVFELDRSERRTEWQQSITELASASHVASSAYTSTRANLRVRTGQLATSLELQRAVVAKDAAALKEIARVQHARISVGEQTYGSLAPEPRMTSTATINAGNESLATVTIGVPLGKSLLVVLQHATSLPNHAALMFVANGRVVAGGPVGADATIRGNKLTFKKTAFAAASAPLATGGAHVYAVEPMAAIDALSNSYRRFLFIIGAFTFAIAAAGATRLGRPLARVVGEISRLRREAQTDGLTGVANRAALDERLSSEVARAERYGTSVSLVLADIDNFKQINDTHGHQTGDEALKAVARVLAESLRELDLAARFGGEEFALVLPGSGLSNARRVAERARRALETIEVKAPSGELLHVTASFGAAEFPTYADPAALIAAADTALYTAKRNGKNQVATATARSLRKLKAVGPSVSLPATDVSTG